MQLLFGVLLTVAALASATAADARPLARDCAGTITDRPGGPVSVTIARGSARCATAKRVLRRYLHSHRRCAGSACLRRRSGWLCESAAELPRLASCSRGRRIIEAYGIAD